MNKKVLAIVVAFLAVAMLATPIVAAKPWDYPKNNPKFEQYGVTINFTFANLVAATYASTAGLEEANKVVVVYEEQAIEGYQIRVGEDGPGQRVYNVGEDFAYYGIGTIVTWHPILPYAFDPTNPMMTLFLIGTKIHWRVDYTYDFGDGDGGLDGTITLLALVTGDSVSVFDPDVKTMFITSVEGTGDFSDVQIQAKGAGSGHEGVVIGWPEYNCQIQTEPKTTFSHFFSYQNFLFHYIAKFLFGGDIIKTKSDNLLCLVHTYPKCNNISWTNLLLL